METAASQQTVPELNAASETQEGQFDDSDYNTEVIYSCFSKDSDSRTWKN